MPEEFGTIVHGLCHLNTRLSTNYLDTNLWAVATGLQSARPTTVAPELGIAVYRLDLALNKNI
jgi:hypothetical protein